MRNAAVVLVGALAVLAMSAAGTAAPRSVLDLGDSLSIGTAPFLDDRLRGFRVEARRDVGLHAYDAAAIVARERTTLPPVIVVSAGTNDDPRIVSTFARAVSAVVAAAGTRRCVVWPTIVRPPAVGASYDRLNRALERAARRHPTLVLVDWIGMVRRHPSWLAPDGVHVSVAGVPGASGGDRNRREDALPELSGRGAERLGLRRPPRYRRGSRTPRSVTRSLVAFVAIALVVV